MVDQPQPSYRELLARCGAAEAELANLRAQVGRAAAQASPVDPYREMFHGSRDGLVAVDLRGRITQANEAFCRMLGYSLEELRASENFYELTPEKWRQWERTEIWEGRLLKRGYSGIYRKEYIRKDGTVFPVELQAYAVPDSDGEIAYLWGVARDVTEQNKVEQGYTRLCQIATDLICIADLQTMTFLEVNPAFTRTLGFSRDELLAAPFVDFVHPDDIESTQRVVTEKLRQGADVISFENRYRCKDGSYRRLLWNSHPIPLEGKTYAIAHDVTDRRRDEEALREALRRQDAAVRAGNVGLWNWDLESSTVSYSREWKRQVGFEEDEIGDSFEEWRSRVHPEDLEHALSVVNEAIESRQTSYQLEFRFRHRDGSYRWIMVDASIFRDESGKAVRVMGSHVDVTERRHIRDALMRKEERFRKLLRNSSDVLAIVDAQGRETYVSESVERLTGWPAEEFVGKKGLDYVHPDDRERLVAGLAHLLAHPHESLRGEYRHRCRDGSWVHLEAIGTNYLDDPDIRGIVLNIRDCTQRVEAEAALRSALQEQRAIFDVSMVGVMMLKNRVITRVNERMAEMLGYRVEEMEGRDPEHLHLSHEHFVDFGERYYWRLAERDIVQVEYPLRHKSGRTVWCLFSGRAIAPPDMSRGAVWIIDDITERKEADQALRESEARFRNLLERLEYVPVQGYDARRRVIYWNAASERVYGYTRQEALGRQLEDLIIPDEMREATIKSLDDWLGGGPAVPPGEMVLRDKSGNPVPVFSSHVMHETEDGEREMFCVDVDLRSLRSAEEALQRLATAIEQSGEIVVITDPDGTIRYVNPAFERVTGYSRREAIGANPRVLQSGEHDDAFYKNLWETIVGGRTWEGRFVNRRKDGRFYTEEASISPVFDESHQIVNYVAVKRDITRELELEEQYRQSQKMESVGRLAGGVAHDFNNMLNVILGNAEMAMEELEPGHPAAEDIREIMRAGKRSADLVRQLLAFARKQTIAPRTLDLNETVGGMLKMLGRLIGEDIELLWKPGKGLWQVRMDPAQIDQILANLCINARDAIQDGGRIAIQTANVRVDEAFCESHVDARPGECVVLSVADTGCGMSADTAEKVFEPFFTTKPVGEGTGLGLATVYGIVRQNGGWATVDSAPGKGTTVSVYLPGFATSARADNKCETQSARPGGAETVLLVEDEAAVLSLAKRLLERLGYRVLAAASPREALAMCEEFDGPIDVLLTDVVMPGMSGRELFDRLRPSRPEMVCLYASGYSADVIAHRGVLDEGVYFLEKPFTLDLLAAKMREVLGEGATFDPA